MSVLAQAINKRQVAAGMTDADPLWIAPGSTPDLGDAKAGVNAVAGYFLAAQTYSGGASAPAVLPADYADGATTESELLLLVLAMNVTVLAATIADGHDGSADSGWGHASQDAAEAAAKALCPANTSTQSATLAVKAAQTPDAGPPADWNTVITYASGKLALSGLATASAKTVQFYGLVELPVGVPEYDELGFGWTRDVYNLLDDAGSVAGADYTSDWVVPETGYPGNAPDPTPDAVTYGFTCEVGDVYAIVSWDFADPAPEAADIPDPLAVGDIVISRQSGDDNVYQCLSTDPVYWEDVTPAPAFFDEPEAEGSRQADTERGIEWMWCVTAGKWRGRKFGAPVVSGYAQYRFTAAVAARAQTCFAEFAEAIEDDAELVVTAVTKGWHSPIEVTEFTSRWLALQFPTAAPAAGGTVHVTLGRTNLDVS